MPKIKFIYFEGCPKAPAQWQQLLEATSNLGWADLDIEKIDTGKAGAYASYKKWGSPAILLGGEEITGYQPSEGDHCRYYAGADGGILSAEAIEKLISLKAKA